MKNDINISEISINIEVNINENDEEIDDEIQESVDWMNKSYINSGLY